MHPPALAADLDDLAAAGGLGIDAVDGVAAAIEDVVDAVRRLLEPSGSRKVLQISGGRPPLARSVSTRPGEELRRRTKNERTKNEERNAERRTRNERNEERTERTSCTR